MHGLDIYSVFPTKQKIQTFRKNRIIVKQISANNAHIDRCARMFTINIVDFFPIYTDHLYMDK